MSALTESAYSSQARYWLANTMLLSGQFRGGLHTLPPTTTDPLLENEILLSRGMAQQDNAQHAEAADTYRATLALARQQDSTPGETYALSYLAEALAWTHPAEAQTHAREVTQRARNQGLPILEESSYFSFAIAAAGLLPDTEVETALEKAAVLAEQTGHKLGEAEVYFAHAWHAAVTNNQETLARHINRLEHHTNDINAGAFWADIARSWLPRPHPRTHRARETPAMARRGRGHHAPPAPTPRRPAGACGLKAGLFFYCRNIR